MTKNTIFTDEEYVAQGFTKEEILMVRRSDILFNKRNEWTNEEAEEYHVLIKILEL